MKNPVVCYLCGDEIKEGEPRFWFPRLPATHPLSDIKGVLHTSCLRVADPVRKIGESVAYIAEDIACGSMEFPLIVRDGNIVSTYSVYEDRVQLYDLENFCEINIPRRFGELFKIECEEVSLVLDMLGTFLIRPDGRLALRIRRPGFEVDLPTLNLARMKLLLGEGYDFESRRLAWQTWGNDQVKKWKSAKAALKKERRERTLIAQGRKPQRAEKGVDNTLEE